MNGTNKEQHSHPSKQRQSNRKVSRLRQMESDTHKLKDRECVRGQWQ